MRKKYRGVPTEWSESAYRSLANRGDALRGLPPVLVGVDDFDKGPRTVAALHAVLKEEGFVAHDDAIRVRWRVAGDPIRLRGAN